MLIIVGSEHCSVLFSEFKRKEQRFWGVGKELVVFLCCCSQDPETREFSGRPPSLMSFYTNEIRPPLYCAH